MNFLECKPTRFFYLALIFFVSMFYLQSLLTSPVLYYYNNNKLKLMFYYQRAKFLAFNQQCVLPYRFHRNSALTLMKALSRPVAFGIIFMASHYRKLNWDLICRKFQILLYLKIGNNFVGLIKQLHIFIGSVRSKKDRN